jgi:hypothetical protein
MPNIFLNTISINATNPLCICITSSIRPIVKYYANVTQWHCTTNSKHIVRLYNSIHSLINQQLIIRTILFIYLFISIIAWLGAVGILLLTREIAAHATLLRHVKDLRNSKISKTCATAAKRVHTVETL